MISDATVRTLSLPAPELDATSASPLREEARRAFAAGVRMLILDFHGVELIDSSGVSCLVELVRQAPAAARVVLVGLNRRTRTVVEATCLGQILEVHERADATLQRIAG